MNEEQLINAADEYFKNTTRSRIATRDGLESLIAHCNALIDSLELEDDE